MNDSSLENPSIHPSTSSGCTGSLVAKPRVHPELVEGAHDGSLERQLRVFQAIEAEVYQLISDNSNVLFFFTV